MPTVSLDWILSQLAGMKFPKQGEAYDFVKKCAKSSLRNRRKERDPQAETPSMDYLLGEIAVDGPDQRAEAMAVNDSMGKRLEWPEGWWAVSDDQFAYVGFFQFEEDAWAYRLYLLNQRMNGQACAKRYAGADEGIAKEEDRISDLQEAKKKTEPVRQMLNLTLDVKVGDNFRTDVHCYEDFEGEAYIVFVAKEGDGTYEGTWDGLEQIDLPPGALKAIRERGDAAVAEYGLNLPEGTVQALQNLKVE